MSADRGAIAGLRTEARRLRALVPGGIGAGLTAGAALSLAYPDRVGQRRPGAAARYLLSGGKGALLPAEDSLAGVPLLVAADLDGDPREAAIRLALPVAESDLRHLHGDRLRRETVCDWSRRDRAVVARARLMLGALALEDRPWPEAPAERVTAAMIEGVRDLGLDALPWTAAARRFVARVAWLRAHGGAEMPDLSAEGLLAGLEDWLGPFLGGMTRAADLARVDLMGALTARLDFGARQRLDRLAPASIDRADRHGAADRLFGCGAVGVGAAAGDVRADAASDAGAGCGAAGGGTVVAGAAAGADDIGPSGVLGQLLRRRAARPPGAVSEASVAGGSGGRGPDVPDQTPLRTKAAAGTTRHPERFTPSWHIHRTGQEKQQWSRRSGNQALCGSKAMMCSGAEFPGGRSLQVPPARSAFS